MTTTEPRIQALPYRDITGTIGEVATILDNYRQQGLLYEAKPVADWGEGRYTVRAYFTQQPDRPALPAAPYAPSPYRRGGLDHLCTGVWVARAVIAVLMVVGLSMFAVWVYAHLIVILAVALGVVVAQIIAVLLTATATAGCAGIVLHCAGCRG